MTTHKVSELTGALLDAAVAKAEGLQLTEGYNTGESTWIDGGACIGHGDGDLRRFAPSIDWSEGGPIIERERIGVLSAYPGWEAFSKKDVSPRLKGAEGSYGGTYLIAAMRAFVASRFGETVELP